jgi:hypothetical protein
MWKSGMRKYIFVAVLLALPSACYAAWNIFQTVQVSQITCDITTGVATGATGPCATPTATVCTGDQVTITRTLSITSGTAVLTSSTSTWVAGDQGKAIVIPGIGPGGGNLLRTIGTVDSATQITLAGGNANSGLSSASTTFSYGSDVSLPLKQFNTWAVANQGTSQVILTMPAGSNCWFGSQQGYTATYPSGSSNNFNSFANGIRNLVVEGAGSTWDSVGGSAYYVGGGPVCNRGMAEVQGCSARIKTVSSGASQIELTAASHAAGYASRFNVGTWLLVGGLNPQMSNNPSTTGYPQNLVYFDWRQVTAKCTDTTGCVGTTILTLDAPLTSTLLDTWPSYTTGAANAADPGGPAAIFAMPDEWNTTVEIKNLTMNQTLQINGAGRNVTYRNVNFPGSGGNCGALPSMNETWSVYTGDWDQCIMETDKLVTNQIMDDVTIRKIDFQSSATTYLTITNSSIGVGGSGADGLNGSGRYTTMTDVTMYNFNPGSYTYGSSNRLVCTRCDVTTFNSTGGGISQAFSEYSMSGGVLSFSNTFANQSAPASRLFGPLPSNTYYVIGGSFSGPIGLFNGSSIVDGATESSVQTNESGGFPSFTSASGATCCATLVSHQMPEFTCDDCTGDRAFVATNIQGGATPLAPLNEFASSSYSPVSGNTTLGQINPTGRIVSLTINVTQAYNGSNSLTLNVLGVGGIETVDQAAGPPWAAVNYNPRINLKVAGIRTITPSGVTCDTGGGPVAGACSGDVGLTLTSAAQWIKKGFNPSQGGTVYTGHTQTPVFTITAQMDQGVVP